MTARWQDPDNGSPLWQHVLVVLEIIAAVIVFLGVAAR